jgi:hypothetical protein
MTPRRGGEGLSSETPSLTPNSPLPPRLGSDRAELPTPDHAVSKAAHVLIRDHVTGHHRAAPLTSPRAPGGCLPNHLHSGVIGEGSTVTTSIQGTQRAAADK